MVPPNAPDTAEIGPTDISQAVVDPVMEAERRQTSYAARRRDWAERVGRPYLAAADPRPPPGELDAEAEE